MVKPKRVGLSVLDDELSSLISANMKIFPVDYSFLAANLNPDNFEYIRVTSIGEFKNHIYSWDDGWELIGADDNSVSWNDIPDKPTSYNPTSHKHTVDEIEDFPDLSLKVDKVVGKELSENDFTNELKDKLVGLGDSASIDYSEMAQRLKMHEENTGAHVTTLEKTAINTIGGKADKYYVDNELAKKADSSTLSGHAGNSTIHVTQSDKDKWNAAEQNAKTYTDDQLANFDSAPEIEIGTTLPTSKIWYKVL